MPNDIPTHGTISWGRRLTPAANAFGLALMLMLGFAQKAGAQSSSAASANGPLTFGNNFFVTGDYVVGGTYGLNTNFANDGTSKGTITIPDGNPGITGAKSVPAGAQIVAALLYWQTVEKISQTGSGQNGFFRPVFNGGPPTGYPITGVSLNSHSTVSFSFGGCTGTSTGKILQTYRADVRAALRQDANGNVLANGTYEVRLPSVGPSTPLTLGATLVLIYRVLAPNVPLNSIVIYDGAFAPTSTSLVMTQTVQGFYDAAESPVSRLTHIVGGGKNYKFQTVYLNNVPLPPMYATGQPFPGYYGGSTGYGWDNTTWTFGPNSNPVHDDDVSATTKVVPTGSNQGCVSWGAVIIGTTVQNSDNDGLLDVWKKIPPGYPNPGYCDAAVNEGVCTPGSSSWVDLPGAAPGQKDVFVQLDYMCRNVTGPNSCNAGNGIDPNGPYSFDPRSPVDPVDGKNALQKVIDAFASSPNHAPVNLHVIPTYAIQEPTCTDTSATPAGLCAFPNQPGVVGWKGGLVFVKNQLVDSATGRLDTCTLTNPPATCVPVFQHGKKDSYHYALFAHALGLPNWTLQAGTLKSVAQFGNTVMFTTSVPVGMLGNAGYNGFDAQGNPIPKADPTCANGRVTVAFAATNSNLNGTHCILNATQPTDTSFTIVIGGNSITTNYTLLTDPNIAVASGEAGTVSGFSDVGGQDSLITLGLWGNPALSTSNGQKVTVKAGTFMHELGHSLGLTHGGFYYDKLTANPPDYTPTVEANCKTNHQSVMNYMFQIDLLDKGGLTNVPDYSGQALDTLNKAFAATVNPFTMTTTYQNTSWHGTNLDLGITVKLVGNPLVPIPSPLKLYCDGTLITNGVQMYRVTRPTSSLSWNANQDINFDGNTGETTFRGHNDWAPTFINNTLITPGVDPRQVGMTGSLSDLVGGGLQGGSGGLQGGSGGVPELTQAVANSFTRSPRNLMVTSEDVSPRNIHLSWAAPTFGQIGAYRIYRSADGGTTFPLLATVPGNQLTYTDMTDACIQNRYEYYVAAVLAGTFAGTLPAPGDGQESIPSNTVSTIGQNTTDPLTGCYTLTGFSSPAAGASAIQGDSVAITWPVQDDFYTPGAFVSNLSTNTLVAIGPIPHDGACSTLGTPPVFLNHAGTYPYPVSILASSGSGLTFNNNQFSVVWNTLPLVMGAGCYFFELDLDSGQHETSSAFTLLILVSGPTITTTALPPATVGTAYSSTLTERGGVAGFTWTLDSGSGPLPAGITLDKTTGALSGTPCATPGSYNFTARVTDVNLDYGTRALTLNVLAAPVAQVNQPLAPESSAPAGASGFILTVNGTGFVPSCSAVRWNGSPRATIFKSGTLLTATISGADVANFGTASISVATTGSPNSNVDFFEITNATTVISLSGTNLATGVSPYGLISADFNGDGKMDLAIANSGDNTVSILLGNGDGTFTAKPTLVTGSTPFSLIAGDFNNDGSLDLAVANFASGAASTVSIFIGNGDGTFKPGVTYAVGGGPISVVTGDFNGDGKLDLAVANQNGQTISILLGNGDGTFQSQVAYAGGVAGTLDVAAVALGDFNGDGKLDLAVTNPSTDQVSILLGNGDGTFQNPVAYSTGAAGSHPIAVNAADFNGDGKLDLAVTNLNTNKVAIFVGSGDGTFQPQVSYSTTTGAMTGPSAMTTGDFNGDGLLDLAITNQNNNSVSILLGNGNGTFQNPLEFTTGNFPIGVAADDFNGDGRLDVAVANHGVNTVSIMLQPQVLLMPSALTFGKVAVSSMSTALAVGLTNNGPGALTISNIGFGGTNPGDFGENDNCPKSPSTLAAGLNCTINVTFAPTQNGARSATLMIMDSASDSPQTVNLSGSAFLASPTNLTANAVAGSGSVNLAWSASTSNSVVSYNVYRATVAGGPYTSSNKIASVPGTAYTDTVATGTTYYYVVTAVDGSGNESAFSNEAFATP